MSNTAFWATIAGVCALGAAASLLWARWELRRWRKRYGQPAARPAAPMRRPDGSHEACELTEGERLWAEYFTRRYSSLGKDVIR